jgi:tetratricopeptide (TPR) repeat protein
VGLSPVETSPVSDLGGAGVAEGVLGGLLGGEEEGRAGEDATEARSGAEAFAAALAADQAKHDPRVARAAETFLQWQARLLRAQFEELSEQRALRLSHLRSQSREGRLRRTGQRIRLAMQILTGLVLGLVGAGLVVMVLDAFNSRSVIVEPFDAPPALAARGLSGKVIAGDFLDELTRLQAAAHANIEKRNLSNAWTSDIKVEVPETGISIGDFDRILKARFGHDLHIGGDLVETDTGGLALTVRGDGVLPKVFSGGRGDLDKLTIQAAEYVFGQSQPSLYAGYLQGAGRNAEAVAFSKAAYATDPAEDRPYLLNVWADALGSAGGTPQATLPLYRQALRLKPDYWTAYNNVMNVAWLLGDEEGVWRTGQAMLKAAGGRPGRAPESDYQNWDALAWNLQAWRAAVIADAASQQGVGTGIASDGAELGDIDVRLHDPTDADFQLQTATLSAWDPTLAAMTHFIHGRIAAEAGNVRQAVTEMEAFGADNSNPVVSYNYPGYSCWIAPAEEAAGHPDKADAALKAGGHFVDCYRFRGDILDHRGDWAGAQAAYAQSVAIAPDLPAGYYSWGVALGLHGDLTGAIAKLQAANQRGPHWADPLKAWGDVLARQSRWREAMAKYDEALKYAPAWAELHQARDAAAHRG